jgi:hypothetical protein
MAHTNFVLEINFDPVKMAESAAAYIKLTEIQHDSFAIAVWGYDDDPRELWEVPEVLRYLKAWLTLVKQMGGNFDHLTDDIMKALLLLSIGQAKIVKTPQSTKFGYWGEL